MASAKEASGSHCVQAQHRNNSVENNLGEDGGDILRGIEGEWICEQRFNGEFRILSLYGKSSTLSVLALHPLQYPVLLALCLSIDEYPSSSFPYLYNGRDREQNAESGNEEEEGRGRGGDRRRKCTYTKEVKGKEEEANRKVAVETKTEDIK